VFGSRVRADCVTGAPAVATAVAGAWDSLALGGGIVAFGFESPGAAIVPDWVVPAGGRRGLGVGARGRFLAGGRETRATRTTRVAGSGCPGLTRRSW
jgi:hypothetical protein